MSWRTASCTRCLGLNGGSVVSTIVVSTIVVGRYLFAEMIFMSTEHGETGEERGRGRWGPRSGSTTPNS